MKLSDAQVGLLKAFFSNEPLASLVQSAIIDGTAEPAIDPNMSNEQLGERVRARHQAKAIVESTFSELKRVTRTNPQPSTQNEAR